MKASYLICLLITIACLLLLDARLRLAFWRHGLRTAIVLLISEGLFLLWDLLGFKLSIFFPGHSQYQLGWLFLPGIPLEEVFFLFVLSYVTLLLSNARRKRP